MEIKITATLKRNRDNSDLLESSHIFNDYEEAFMYVMDTLNYSQEFTATHVVFKTEVVE